MGQCRGVKDDPWWHPTDEDRGWDRPLPDVIRLSPDYGVELPLWGDGFGNISWQYTKFSPGWLDRLAAWQREFDRDFHYETGWSSDEARDRWVSKAEALAADVQAELGTRSRVEVGLYE